MKIQIDGTGTLNKGAELMLYSLLEQIEIKHPESTVIFNSTTIGKSKIETSLYLIKPARLRYTSYLRTILNKFRIPSTYFTSLYPIPNVDVVFDASGFKYGDQWAHTEQFFKRIEKYYKNLKSNDTKIILFPQAFGPFEDTSNKKLVEIFNNYVDLIFARELTSKTALIDAGVNSEKVLQYPDFTSLVKGVFPDKYKDLKDAVCIIPNNKMITHTDFLKEQYLKFYDNIITQLNKTNKVFLLNHEGEDDLRLCQEIKSRFNFELPIVDKLNAKEIKGIIKESKLVISSRFHGVANALCQAVPCISTSWSHKYELLMKDYGVEEYVLKIDSDPKTITKMISDTLQPEKYRDIKAKLEKEVVKTKNIIEEMWSYIWTFIG